MATATTKSTMAAVILESACNVEIVKATLAAMRDQSGFSTLLLDLFPIVDGQNVAWNANGQRLSFNTAGITFTSYDPDADDYTTQTANTYSEGYLAPRYVSGGVKLSSVSQDLERVGLPVDRGGEILSQVKSAIADFWMNTEYLLATSDGTGNSNKDPWGVPAFIKSSGYIWALDVGSVTTLASSVTSCSSAPATLEDIRTKISTLRGKTRNIRQPIGLCSLTSMQNLRTLAEGKGQYTYNGNMMGAYGMNIGAQMLVIDGVPFFAVKDLPDTVIYIIDKLGAKIVKLRDVNVKELPRSTDFDIYEINAGMWFSHDRPQANGALTSIVW